MEAAPCASPRLILFGTDGDPFNHFNHHQRNFERSVAQALVCRLLGYLVQGFASRGYPETLPTHRAGERWVVVLETVAPTESGKRCILFQRTSFLHRTSQSAPSTPMIQGTDVEVRHLRAPVLSKWGLKVWRRWRTRV